MAKKKVKIPKKIVIGLIIFTCLATVFLLIWFKHSNQVDYDSDIYKSKDQLFYSKSDVFSQIETKKNQIDLDSTYGLGDTIRLPYFSDAALSELKGLRETNIVGLKCMPEQIYFGRFDYPYSISSIHGNLPIILNDPKLVSLVNILKPTIKEGGMVLSQFLACETEDGRYIVKYNPIEKINQLKGFKEDSKIKAMFAEVLPDGKVNVAKSIDLDSGMIFCKTPIALTDSNLLYFSCNLFKDIYENPKATYLYKIDFNNSTSNLISKCDYTDSSPYYSCN